MKPDANLKLVPSRSIENAMNLTVNYEGREPRTVITVSNEFWQQCKTNAPTFAIFKVYALRELRKDRAWIAADAGGLTYQHIVDLQEMTNPKYRC